MVSPYIGIPDGGMSSVSSFGLYGLDIKSVRFLIFLGQKLSSKVSKKPSYTLAKAITLAFAAYEGLLKALGEWSIFNIETPCDGE